MTLRIKLWWADGLDDETVECEHYSFGVPGLLALDSNRFIVLSRLLEFDIEVVK